MCSATCLMPSRSCLRGEGPRALRRVAAAPGVPESSSCPPCTPWIAHPVHLRLPFMIFTHLPGALRTAHLSPHPLAYLHTSLYPFPHAYTHEPDASRSSCKDYREVVRVCSVKATAGQGEGVLRQDPESGQASLRRRHLNADDKCLCAIMREGVCQAEHCVFKAAETSLAPTASAPQAAQCFLQMTLS